MKIKSGNSYVIEHWHIFQYFHIRVHWMRNTHIFLLFISFNIFSLLDIERQKWLDTFMRQLSWVWDWKGVDGGLIYSVHLRCDVCLWFSFFFIFFLAEIQFYLWSAISGCSKTRYIRLQPQLLIWILIFSCTFYHFFLFFLLYLLSVNHNAK